MLLHQPGMASTMAGIEGTACPEWEAELYKTRVCTSYTCQSCSQEWCTDLCHKLKLDFGACNKVAGFVFRCFHDIC